ncbi:hypothetical protein GF373_03195 [bacterium]|nr:hypothetical protein [bacterium]
MKKDIAIHFVFFLGQVLILAWNDIGQSGFTPSFIYPFWAGIVLLTIVRQQENASPTRFGMVYTVMASLVLTFCLLNDMTRDFWAFGIHRYFPVIVRLVAVQGFLLFIHPQIFPLVARKVEQGICILRNRGYFVAKLPLLLLIIGLVAWLLRNQHITPDGHDWIVHSAYAGNWTRYLREPLSVFIFRSSVVFLGLPPYLSITLVTILAGLLASIILVIVIWKIFPAPLSGYVMALLLSCAGYTALFFGNIEVYALLQLGLAMFLFSTVKYWRDQWPGWVVGVAYALLAFMHLSAVWWFPCFLAVPFVRAKRMDNWSTVGKEMGKLLASFFAVSFCVVYLIALQGYGGNITAMLEHFTSDQVLYVGSDGAMFHPISTYFTWEYYLAMLNEYVYLMPGIVLLLPILFWRAKQTAWNTKQNLWFIGLAGLYLAYSLVWHADRPLAVDWDIFSGLTIPAVILLGKMVQHSQIREEAKPYLLYQGVCFSASFLFLQILHNHLRVSPYWPNNPI